MSALASAPVTCRLLALVALVLLGVARAQAPADVIAWGPERQGFQAGLAVADANQQMRRPFDLRLYLRVPEATTAGQPPTLLRPGRLLRQLGQQGQPGRFYFPEPQATADARVYRLDFARMCVTRMGPRQYLAVQPIVGPDGPIDLDTGVLVITCHEEVDSAWEPPPLTRDAARSLTRERLVALPIPRYTVQDLPLSDLRRQLHARLSLYDPYGGGANIVWAPHYLPDDPRVSVALQDTSLLGLLQAVAAASEQHVTIDTAGVIVHRDPEVLNWLELNRTASAEARDQAEARARAVAYPTYTVSRHQVRSLLRDLQVSAAERQTGDGAMQLSVELPDELLDRRMQFDWQDLDLYDLVRYLALSIGCRYELREDRITLVP